MILVGEGNFTDETILSENNLELQRHNTVGLLISVQMTLENIVRYYN